MLVLALVFLSQRHAEEVVLKKKSNEAEVLKKMTDVAVRRSEEQLVELRADIKVNFLLLSALH